MAKLFTFELPSQAVQPKRSDAEDNKKRLLTLRKMMKNKQKLSVKFYVSRDGMPRILVESQKTSQFSLPLTEDTYTGLVTYLENGQTISEDADCDTPITFEGKTADLQESILRQCVLAKKPLQWLPSFLERNGLMTCILNLWMGNIRLSVKRSDKLVQFLHENGHNV